jgi:hypothetical protein
METLAAKKIAIGFNGKLEEDLKKKLSYLEPKGASKRTIYNVPSTFEKAHIDIYLTQEKFNKDREKLRLCLNSPIKLKVDSPITDRSNRSSPFKVQTRSIPRLALFKTHLNQKDFQSKNNSSVIEKSLDYFMENCTKLRLSNKTLVEKIPVIRKSYEKEIKKMNRLISKTESKFSDKARLLKRQEKMDKMILSETKHEINAIIPKKLKLIKFIDNKINY